MIFFKTTKEWKQNYYLWDISGSLPDLSKIRYRNIITSYLKARRHPLMSLMKAEWTLRWSDGSPPNADRVVSPCQIHPPTGVWHTHIHTKTAPQCALIQLDTWACWLNINWTHTKYSKVLHSLRLQQCWRWYWHFHWNVYWAIILYLSEFHLFSIPSHSLYDYSEMNRGIRGQKESDKHTEIYWTY